MQVSKFVALAFAVLGLGAAPAAAAPVDYFLNIPLFSSDVPSHDTGLTLRGTLTYDNDGDMTGHGTFALGDQAAQYFTGLTFLLDLSTDTTTSTGVLFDGASQDGSSLYMNLATTAADAASGSINYCTAGGCSFFSAVGANLGLAQTAPITLPSMPIGLPGPGVSPVPLPPAVSLFGGALLALAGAATFRHARPKAIRVQGRMGAVQVAQR